MSVKYNYDFFLPVTEKTFGLAVMVLFLSMFCIVASFVNLFLIGINMASGYELTQNDIEEGRILDLCIDGQIYLDHCNQIYGGKNYGDRLQ